jgi:hypothetical protein
VPSRARLDKLDARLAELESEAEERQKAAASARDYPTIRLRSELELLFHPVVMKDASERDRRYLWPWWQLLRLLSDYTYSVFPQLEYVAGSVADAIVAWRRDLFDAAENSPAAGHDPSADPAIEDEVDWNPINVVTLHDLKHRLRIDQNFDEPGREPYIGDVRSNRHLGIPQAEQVSHFFMQFTKDSSPWAREFDANPENWPAEHREEILRRLTASQSIVPEHVPPFDWGEVKTYIFMHPFPRDRDGRPLSAAFDDDMPCDDC